MAVDQESFNKQLYDLLKIRGYKPVPKNARNQNVEASQVADVIEFTFTKDGEEYGKAWASIDDAQRVVVYYDSEQADSPEGKTPGSDFDDSWTGFLKHLKSWALRKQLDFELSNKDRLSDDMRQREYYKMKEKISEGYYPMGKQASYNDNVPSIKIILQHTRQIQEGEQRFRNIAKIFLENAEGERILAPTTRPGIAQVYARHLAEGGLPNDERWNHIKSICEEYNKMAGFVRATKGKQFNETAQPLINEGINHYNSLRETLSKMRGHRGYNAYFESWTPALMENEGDENLAEMFVEETLDPRIESVMPILSRLRKNIGEMTEVKALESWADDIISEKMDSTTKSLAVPADEMLEGDIGDPEGTGQRAYDRKHLAKDVDILDKLEKKALDKAKQTTLPPKKLKEAPGAETLAHNQNTEKSNLKAFDLDEESNEGRPYIVVHAKKGRFETHANSSYEAAKKAAQKWGLKSTAGVDAYLADIKHTPVNESESSQAAASSIIRRIMNQHVDLLGKYGPVKVMAAIDDITQGLDDLDEIGSSDVSIWTKQVIQDLESGYYNHVDESHDPEVKDRVDRLEKLKQNAGPEHQRAIDDLIQMLKRPGGEEGEKSKQATRQADRDADDNSWSSVAKPKDLVNIMKLALGLGEESINEGFSTEGEETLAKIAAAGDDGYDMIEDGINGLLGTEAQIMLQDMYDDISIEYRLHPDDDFEKIYDRMMDRIEKDYGDSDADKIEEVDMGQADRTLRHTSRGADDGKMSHITSLSKAAKKMGHDSYMDVPDDAVEKLKALAKRIRSGEEVEEGLDANQKRVGQLGPTEKVGPNGAVGKLVGASESIERDPLDDIKRLLGN